MNPLIVLTMVSNPCRYRSRYKLYREFEQYVAASGAELFTVEMAFGERPFEVTSSGNERHVQLRHSDEMWHKENAINVGLSALSRSRPDWKYVAWIDSDVTFGRPDWAVETVHQLQHYSVVQMFSRATDLSPTYEPMATYKGFVASYQAGEWGDTSRPDPPYQHFHPGFAWAARRDAIETLGGLFDKAILGAGDRHMAMALLSDVSRSYPAGITSGYVRHLQQYQFRAAKLRKNVGHVPGLLLHGWHGKKADRRYRDRWRILVENSYDPDTDLCRDAQGLYQLVDDGSPRHVRLRDQIRQYFAVRNEDSIDVA